MEGGVLDRVFGVPVVGTEFGHGVAVNPVGGLHARGAGHLPSGELAHGFLEGVVEGHFVKVIGEQIIPDHIIVLVHFEDVVVIEGGLGGEGVAVLFRRGEQVREHQDVLVGLEQHVHGGRVVTHGVAGHLVVVVHAGERDVAHDLAVEVADGQVGGHGVTVGAALHVGLLAGGAHDVAALQNLGGMFQFADVLPFFDDVAVHVDQHATLTGGFHAEHGKAALAFFRLINGGAVRKSAGKRVAHAGHHRHTGAGSHTHEKMTSIHEYSPFYRGGFCPPSKRRAVSIYTNSKKRAAQDVLLCQRDQSRSFFEIVQNIIQRGLKMCVFPHIFFACLAHGGGVPKGG